VVKAPPLRVWPEPENDEPYGPTPKQRLLFIEDLPDEDTFLEDAVGEKVNIRRPHYHEKDVVLFIGGSGSGKSLSAVARVLTICLRYPGTKAVVGSLNQPILQRNLKPMFKDRLSIGTGQWNHPVVLKGPTDKRPTIIFRNGSEILFQNLEDPDVIRGLNADLIFIDECNLLPSGDSVDELLRRLRLHNVPLKQLILTMNPEASNGWPYGKFGLRQYEKSYIERGGQPFEVAARCKCQFCHHCLNADKGEFLWDENRSCPNCSKTKPIRTGYKEKVFDCPGDQQFFRVIKTRSQDNKHNPASFVQDLKAQLDEESFQRYVEGEIGESRKGRCYGSFSEPVNVVDKNIPIDPKLDLCWANDFNTFPMSSVVIQETDSGPVVIDNIIGWDKDMEDVVEMFAKAFPLSSFTGTVHVFGDANGWWGQGSSKKRTNYQIIMDDLSALGYVVHMHVPKRKRNPSIVDRINCVNKLLRGKDGSVRLMVNPQARHLIESLKGVKWNPKTNKEDEACDKAAKKSTNKLIPMVMTHPAAALGYYVHTRFPILKNKPPAKFVYIPNKETILENEQGEFVSQPVEDKQQVIEEREEAVSKQLRQEYGVFIPRRVLRERVEREAREEEERERRIAEKAQRLLSGR
jgi:hypothetical protein